MLERDADEPATEGASAIAIRRLRAAIATPDAHDAAGWRDDLRLFAITWAAGFLFFLIVIA